MNGAATTAAPSPRVNVLRDTQTILDLRACQWPRPERSGQGARRLLGAAWFVALLCVVLCGALPSRARAQSTLQVLLNVPADSGLFDRVLGQVNDLPVTIQVVAEADVRLAIGVVALSPVGWRIDCQDHARDEHQTREVISDEAHPLTQSAADEAAALVIRSLLQAILRADQEARAPIPAAGTIAEPAALSDEGASNEEASNKQPHPPSLWLGAGSQLALVTSADLATSLWGRAGWRWDGYALAAEGRYGLGVDVGDEVASTTIATHALLILARVNVLKGSQADLALSSFLGTHVFVRRDVRVATGWQATPSKTLWSPSFGVALEGRVALFGGLALHLAVGADALTRIPTLDRRSRDGQVRTLATVSWLVPRLVLGLELWL